MEQLFDSEVDYADFDEVRNRLILLMLYSTGIRRAELIDLLDCNVGDAELKVHGKRNKDRIVPIGEELRSEIAEYRKLRDEILPEKSASRTSFSQSLRSKKNAGLRSSEPAEKSKSRQPPVG